MYVEVAAYNDWTAQRHQLFKYGCQFVEKCRWQMTAPGCRAVRGRAAQNDCRTGLGVAVDLSLLSLDALQKLCKIFDSHCRIYSASLIVNTCMF